MMLAACRACVPGLFWARVSAFRLSAPDTEPVIIRPHKAGAGNVILIGRGVPYVLPHRTRSSLSLCPWLAGHVPITYFCRAASCVAAPDPVRGW
ncbi:hypothetical protein GDO81_020258 [Engystomops pustulosus]|uniref:Secreted protein n=1 Tax=Engystomops pustulosus TaxID=76066 RepID=A0AAV6ZNZ5_ENGPU|nr:hypothetical protein GDO81_020258 [Engystomops pustulosus]